jgi:hypothetical protein
MNTGVWHEPVRGDDIEQSLLPRLQQDFACIYLWRRVLPLNDRCFLNQAAFEDYLKKHTSTHFLKSVGMVLGSARDEGEISIRPDFIRIREVQIGGGQITSAKVEELRALENLDARLEAFTFLQRAACQFGPILYLGETECLLTRLRNHVAKGSPLRVRLGELGLDIADTMFYCFGMDGTKKRVRQMYEQLLTHLLVAPLTFRAG